MRFDATSAYLAVSLTAVVLVIGVCGPRMEEPKASGGIASTSSSAFTIPPAYSALGTRPVVEGASSPGESQAGEMRAAPFTLAVSDAEAREREFIAAVVAEFHPRDWQKAIQVGACESRYDPGAIGALGERGAWQVQPAVWGPVDSDVRLQARQAAAIVAIAGWKPWACQ